MLRPKPKMKSGIAKGPRRRFPGHLAWIRKHACIVSGCERRDIQACHVRAGLPAGEQAGMGEKPADWWTFPACSEHHSEQHNIGEPAFCKRYGVNLVEIAKECARLSPHRFKWLETEVASEKTATCAECGSQNGCHKCYGLAP